MPPLPVWRQSRRGSCLVEIVRRKHLGIHAGRRGGKKQEVLFALLHDDALLLYKHFLFLLLKERRPPLVGLLVSDERV
jgi:hypothetical protein